MGILKQYLRYVPGPSFGIIGYGNSISYITKFSEVGKYVAVPACESIYIWDLRKNSKIATLHADVNGTISVIRARPPFKGILDNTHIAAGYNNGAVVLFDTVDGQATTFTGHKGCVSALCWDPSGMRLASGSTDGEIVLWDVVSEKGIVRLTGHKGMITQLRFLVNKNMLISSGKDSYIKFWDLETNSCIFTLAEHKAEVWDFIITDDDSKIIVGSGDSELRVWSLVYKEDLSHEMMDVNQSESEFIEENSLIHAKSLGSLMRSRTGRVCGLVTDGRVVACYGKKTVVDMFVLLKEDEVSVKAAERLKKARKKARKRNEEGPVDEEYKLVDYVHRLPSFEAENRLSGLDVYTDKSGAVYLSSLLADNRAILYKTHIKASDKKGNNNDEIPFIQLSSLHRPGHRTDIRAVTFNSFGDEIATASGESIKLWSRNGNQVIKTMNCEYALCLIMPPGDRHILIGTKSGCLELYDIGSGSLLDSIKAHECNSEDGESGIYGLAVTHDKRGFISGGTDCLVKFWNFELVDDTESGKGKRLSFIQDSHALKVPDQVTCVRCSPDGKFIVVATIDMKETLYYRDTLKLCHELYGKSSPSTCLDFTDDGTIVVTGSEDTCIRIFGTNFGDQRKLFKNAHQGGVTDVAFVSKTHYFFSCGRDGTVKQWDADKFQRILTLNGHVGIVRCLSVSPKGDFLVSCGQDKSIRLWKRTEEPLVLQEEREDEREKEKEEELLGMGQRPVIPGEEGAQAVRPSITSHETEKAVDQLIEALSIYEEQLATEDSKPHYLMTYVYKTEDPLMFVLLVLRKIKSSELEEAILMLPLDKIIDLLKVITKIIEYEWDIELSARVLLVAVRVNMTQLMSSQEAGPILREISSLLPNKLNEYQDMIGFNLAGLRLTKDRLEMKAEVQLFADAAQRVQEKRKKKQKRDAALKRALLTL